MDGWGTSGALSAQKGVAEVVDDAGSGIFVESLGCAEVSRYLPDAFVKSGNESRPLVRVR